MNTTPPPPRTTPLLPFGALAAVAALAVAMLGADLVLSRRVADRVETIVDNTQRSIEIADDLRAQAQRLAGPTLSADELRQVTARIVDDARAFEPTVAGAREREEWRQLQEKLARLQESADGREPARVAALLADVGRSIDHLVAINREQARREAAFIREAHHSALVADATAGGVMVALMVGVALVLLRAIRRERALLAERLALVEERNRELDAFAGRAAHDLRAPLNPIRGYADLIVTGDEPPEEIRSMASRIRVAVDRMARVVDDMLELSRAGRPEAGAAAPVAIGREVLDELGPELHGVDVESALGNEGVACAPGVLAQILRNLVGNALKFRSRKRKLHLKLASRAVDGAVELVVEDNGVGMDAESAAHAFEPYFRGRPDLEVPGHGLGLAIVERTTRALGGSCTLVSAPDEGTRITLRLPRA